MIDHLNIDELKNKEVEFNGIEIHKQHLINPDIEIEHPPIAISVGFNQNFHTPLVTYGNFACIVGASKSMKSFLKTALNACYIGGKAQNYFSEIIGHDTKGKYIIDVDTEQSDYHVHKAANRVLTMVGNRVNNYKMFALRSINPKERMQFIEWLFNESDYKGKIGLCSIDGVADLVENVNDLDRSNEVTQKLMSLSYNHKSAILTVLHRNFESDKPTGHLGSAILKKAETVLFVDKEDSIVNVKPRYTRNIPFEPFSFSLNEESIPEQNDKIIF